MSKVKIVGNASGSGTLTLTGPDTNSDRTITLPDSTGTLAVAFAVGDITGATALAEQPGQTDEIILSDAGTLKRLDIAHISNTPAFQARQSADQNSLADSATVKVSFNVQDFSTGGTYNTGTYRWTPGVAGKYYIGARVRLNAGDSVANQMTIWLYLNGSVVAQSQHYIENANNYGSAMTGLASKIFDLDDDDYVEVYAKYNTSDSSTWSLPADTGVFFGYRITGA